jgi:GT2 family glycosyltransferase
VPTAVVQIEIDQVPRILSVADRHTRALVIARRHGRPVGGFYVSVRDGHVDMPRLHAELARAIRNKTWRWKVDEYVGAPPSAATRPECTVAICTRERPDDLTRALQAVCALRPQPAAILVVDNHPATSRTREVVDGFPMVRYVREDHPGLDAARNRALTEARTPVVAFTDDDAVPETDWLEHLLRPFADPRVRCSTGLTLPLELETPAQEWFERYSPFGRGFERRVFDGTRHDPVAVNLVGAGVNMAMRRSVLDELGGFDEALDAGTASRSGGDHEMFGRLLAAGHRIVYEPAAVSWHRHRRSWTELRDTLYGYGVGVYAMWTRRLLFEREPAVLRHAVRWLRHGQVPSLWRAVRRDPDSIPLDLQFAQLRGCAAGPWAYFRARREQREGMARPEAAQLPSGVGLGGPVSEGAGESEGRAPRNNKKPA